MNKRITSLFLSVVMICSLLVTAVPAWAAPGDSGVTASVTQAAPGDTFSVTLKLPGTERLISDISLKVHFDSAVFEVTEYTIPSIPGMEKMQSNVEEANSNAFFAAVYLSLNSEADIPFTDGLEVTAYFKVKADASLGDSEFKLDNSTSVASLTDMGLPDILVPYEDFVNKSATIKVVGAPKPAESISLNKTNLTLTAGEDETLVATVTPSDSTDTVTWESNKTNIATVDATGKGPEIVNAALLCGPYGIGAEIRVGETSVQPCKGCGQCHGLSPARLMVVECPDNGPDNGPKTASARLSRPVSVPARGARRTEDASLGLPGGDAAFLRPPRSRM